MLIYSYCSLKVDIPSSKKGARRENMKTEEQFSEKNPNPMLTVEKDGIVRYSNEAGEFLLHDWGIVVGEKLPSYIGDLVQRIISRNSPEKMEVKAEKRVYLVAFHPLPKEECVNIYGFDISEQKELEEKLRIKEKQNDVLYKIGKIALEYESLQTFMDESIKLIASTLEQEYCKIMELMPDGNFLLRAGIGWKPEFVGKSIVGENKGSQAGYTLLSEMPVIMEDFEEENRFDKSKMLKIHGVASETSVIIGSMEKIYGVLVVNSTKKRNFTSDDTYFLNSVAFLIAQAIERKRAEEALKKAHDNLENLVIKRTSELEEAYNSLKESERSLAEAQKMAHLGNWTLDFVTGEAYRSNEIYRIFGRSYQKFGAAHDVFLSYIHPEDRDYVNNAIMEALNGKPYSIDFRIILPDGEERITHEIGEVIFDEKNIPIRMKGTTQDITEFKKAEEKIRNLANIVESSNDAIITESLDSIIISWNKGAEQVYGYSAEEILGKAISVLEPDNLKEETKRLAKKIKQGKKIRHYETLRLKKDGTLINISISLSPIFGESGKLVAISAITRDITEHKKAEEALRLSNIYNRSLIEASLDPLVTIGHDGKITDVNGATEQVTGYSRSELIGTDFTNYFTESEKAKKGHQEVFREGGVFDYELEIRNKKGHVTPVLYNASIYKNVDGEVIGILAAARDIAKRKQAEMALHKAYENLQVQSEEIQVQSEELQAQSEELQVQYEELQVQSGELHKAYESLHESENKFRTLTENSPDLITRFDRRNRHIYANSAAVRLYGCSQEEIIGKTHTELGGDPELVKFLERHYENVFITGKTETVEFQYTSPQGKEYYFNTRIVPEFINSEVISVLAISRDITEHKKTEEKIQSLANIVESSNDAIGTISLNGIITSWNKGAEEVYGYSAEETLGKPISIVAPPHLNKETRFLTEMVKQGEKIHHYETLRLRKDEKIIYVSITLSPVFDIHGELTAVSFISRDITERKEAEEAIRLSNIYNRSLIEASLDPLVTIGHDGKITDVNGATETITGYSRNELIGTDFSDYFAEPEKAKGGHQRVFQEGLVRDYLLGIQNKDGQITPVLYNASVYKNEDDKIIGIFAAARDISKLKKAEEKIQILANALESSDDAIMTKSLDGIITSWNKGAEKTYGYLAEEIIGKNLSILEPDNRKGEIKHFSEKIKRGEQIQHYETSRLKKDGTIINVSVTLSPVFNSSRELMALSAIVRDITERKKAEKTLANIEIARKKEIHHRIKNNLQVISSLLDLQAEKFKNRECIKDSEILEAFRESQNRVISMALIHEELYKGGGFEKLNFSPYIEELAENLFLTYRLGNTDISLNMDLEENLLFDIDTAIPLGMVVNELVSNSLKHAFSGRDKGEIQIKLGREKPEKYINRREESKSKDCKSTSFTMIISDNGVGIPENLDIENLESLGFQLVTSLVDQLDGELELKRNNGTEFGMRFTVTEK